MLSNKVIILFLCISTAGCASSKIANDPFENVNRQVFNFNEKLDSSVLAPVSRSYTKLVPTFLQNRVGDFFGNIGDAWSGLNQLLQGDFESGSKSISRVGLNSTFGLLGLLDFASEAGLPRKTSDFGMTLARWGVGAGPYLVLPFVGPSNFRDASALSLDYKGNLWNTVTPFYQRNIGSAVRIVDERASVSSVFSLVDDIALDKYSFVRDAYTQRRDAENN